MKKISIILFIGALFLTGCRNKEEEYKEILEGYAKTYYEDYMIGVENQQQVEITIEMLKNANENGARYDLSKLKKCKDSTTVVVDLNEKKEIVKYNYDLKCD